MRVEERRVVKFEHGQVDAGRDRFDRGGDLVAGLVGLHLHLAGVRDHMGVGQDALALDHDTAARDLLRWLLRPRPAQIGVAHGGENLDDRGFDRARGRGGGGDHRCRRGRRFEGKGRGCQNEAGREHAGGKMARTGGLAHGVGGTLGNERSPAQTPVFFGPPVMTGRRSGRSPWPHGARLQLSARVSCSEEGRPCGRNPATSNQSFP